MLWIANTLSCQVLKKDGWWLQHVAGVRCSRLCSWLCTAAKPTFFSWLGVQAGTRFARSLAEPGMPLPSRCLQQLPTPGSLPVHTLSNTSHGKRHWRKSPHLVSKVLDDKSLIWQTWFFKEGTFIQMSIVEFLGPRVIRAFWHLWKRTHSRLKCLENFSVAKETKKMGDKTLWFAFKLQPRISSTAISKEASNQLCACPSNTLDWALSSGRCSCYVTHRMLLTLPVSHTWRQGSKRYVIWLSSISGGQNSSTTIRDFLWCSVIHKNPKLGFHWSRHHTPSPVHGLA